jgi:hypothetical protein
MAETTQQDKPEFYTDEHKEFLDELRESGATNMFGAAPYLQHAFPELDKHKARDVLLYWMRTF